MKKRAWVLFGLLTVFSCILAIHLYNLIKTEPAQVAASQNFRTVSAATTRGTIYDTNLRPLVNCEKEYVAAVRPDETVLTRLRPLLDDHAIQSLRDRMLDGQPAVVRLDDPVAIADGIRLFFTPKRYGQRLLAPHLIGYLDSGSVRGIAGVEAAYDEQLRRYSGELTVSFPVSGTGECLTGVTPTVSDTTARSTGGVVLTIDRNIQQIVEDTAPEFISKGAVIVMQPDTGAILALASFPTFQPHTVADSIAADDGALVNRGLALYDCGSVFKIVTAAAALETGVPLSQAFDCAGGMMVENTLFHCHERLGHQTLLFTNAFAQSCNLYFIQLAQQIGAETLYNAAVDFGFSEPIILAENLGTPAAVLPTQNELRHDAALANLSFGQGKLLASPLHITRMVAAIVNNGVIPTACVIRGYVDENGAFSAAEEGRRERIVSAETAGMIRSMMEKVVTDGTGRQAASASFTTAGKTGTAETGQKNGVNPVVQSWFTGYFPADDPQYVITVLAEDAQNTNGRAAALFCEISNKLIESK